MKHLEIPEGYELVDVPLPDVAFRPETVKRKIFDDGREIDFYEAEADQFVKAYADGRVVWAPVAGFSVHRNIRVVIVNLENGGQVVTDHDPRAVFGVAPTETEPRRFYPDEAFSLGVLVPCQTPDGLSRWGTDRFHAEYTSLWDALAKKAEILATERLGSLLSWTGRCWALDSNDMAAGRARVQWAGITSVDYTNQLETGYDLTVPGYETFMSADGVILSNTMSIHLPSGAAAIKDVREKMMASKMLWSVKDRNTTVPQPKHEQVLGLNMGQTPSGKKHQFKSNEDAMAAIESGAVDLNDDIDITP